MMSLIASFLVNYTDSDLERTKVQIVINNLKDLVDLLGNKKVDRLFTEYLMLKIAKANQFDEVASKIDLAKYISKLDTE